MRMIRACLTATAAFVLAVTLAGQAAQSVHWSYIAPERPRLPDVVESHWPRNAIDHFTLAQMTCQNLQPSDEAGKRTLIRRVTLDLTGLPPTPEEVAAFLADASPRAFERLVDRLLDSPRFGERVATQWLDLARYADTHGYHMDAHRDMWRWRDWVIAAYNSNMPFDQFTVEQLAGDLLPNSTLSQLVATGFNRNNMVNFENGIIGEEFRTEYVIDRVVTTSTVWLGQTMVCARCHDHKYDPFTQRDFYRFFAFFNSVPENGVDGDKGNAAPFIAAPLPHQEQQMKKLRQRIASLDLALRKRAASIDRDLAGWAAKVGSDEARKISAKPVVHASLDESTPNNISVPGKVGEALLFNSKTYLELGDQAKFDRDDCFSIVAWIKPTTRDRMVVIGRRNETGDKRGFSIELETGRIVCSLVHRDGEDAIRIKSDDPLTLYKWRHVAATYDGSGTAQGLSLFVDGVLVKTTAEHDTLTASIEVDAPLRIGSAVPGESFRGMIDDVRLYGQALTREEIAILAGGNPIGEILAVDSSQRTKEQNATLRKYYLDHVDPEYGKNKRERTVAIQSLRSLTESLPTTMVMKELPEPRTTYLLINGRYDGPGEQVAPGVPEFLARLPQGQPADRLGLANWIVNESNPLTSRVAVNRLWQLFFGDGIVRTPEDFGSRGDPPTHPELLDWLAREFVDSGWDVKQMVRLIVTSATYRQSSRLTKELVTRDPDNLWLARAPRLPLTAEMIRDSGLSTSGLLVERTGGPSVFPYQPPGLWEEISYNPVDFTAQVFRQSHGGDLYRRSLYAFWKRSSPSPTLAAFGAPTRETCIVKRSRTSTPQQAFVLMNDVTFVEAARALAQDSLRIPNIEARHRLNGMFERILSRPATRSESGLLLRLYEDLKARYRADPELAQGLSSVGESRVDTKIDRAELSAWTAIANVILSLDETVTRN
jgi:hypothetical protein